MKNIIKNIIITICSSSLLFGISDMEKEYLKQYNFDKTKYENLDKNINIDKKYINMEKDFIKKQEEFDVFEQMNFAKNMMPENDYITKEEFNILQNKINEIKEVSGTGPYSFLLYFTSSSVPTNTLFNILYSLSILQDNNINIYSKQYLIGPPEDFKEYMYKMNDDLNERFKSFSTQEKIKRNYGIKIDPRYFEYFKIKEAPAMALATCPALTPDIEKCKFHYFMRGDVGLLKFFDKISQEDKRYEKITKILIANKIVDKEGN